MSEKTQWDGLKAFGLSDLAAAVVMGNAQCESGCETNRLQGDFEATRSWSRSYTSMVDSGEISRDDFIFRGPSGGGYGWLQWTERSRKAGYYDNARRLGVSIGSEEAALSWFWAELHQPGFAVVLDALEHGTDLRAMSDVFLRRFEMPADQSEAAAAYRAARCQEMLDRFGGSTPDAQPAVEDRDLAVASLQACMARDGYWSWDSITGKNDPAFREKLKEYAADVAAT